MPKAFKHTGVLMMLAVVALGLVGAGYALWYEELKLDATVNTGTFDADWSIHNVAGVTPASNAVPVACVGEPGSPLGSKCDEVSEYLTVSQLQADEKLGFDDRVARKLPTCSAAMGVHGAGTAGTASDGDNNGTPDDNLLTLTVNNAYPYSGCKFAIDIHNSGTVPMHFSFEEIEATTPSRFIGLIGVPGTGSTAGPPTGPTTGLPAASVATMCAAIGKALAGDPYPQYLNGNGVWVQLHGGEEIDCDIIVYLKEYSGEGTGNIAPEGAALTLEWEIIAHQWNEKVNTANHPFTEPE